MKLKLIYSKLLMFFISAFDINFICLPIKDVTQP